jgi:hypothetical protein
MSQLGMMIPIVAIAIGPVCWVANNWIRARHGHEMERFEGEFEKRDKETGRTVALLTNENEKLNGQVSRLEERIAVLERIVTDPADRTARAIDQLR